MPASLKQKGFSLPEVLLAMVLLVMVVTGLSGYHRALVNGFNAYSQYQQLWRYAWQQTQRQAMALPPGWQVKRMQTTTAGCVSISVTITSPVGRQGQLSRLHCPNRQ
nr:prepilin-type N-terminal cleavage/methylation domain-containing protein [uncultured Enterobacter sp.]